MTGEKRLVGSVAWGVGGAAGQALFQLLVFIALARALSPEAFGVVAIATAVIDLLNFIGRGGITEVLVQRRDLEPRAMNAGFLASLICGAVLTLALVLAAPLFAHLFDTPELRGVVIALAPICLLYAAGAVYEGILRHAFQFKQLALRNTSSTIVSGLIALAMALTGWGVWALVAQRLVATVWSLAAMVVATRWLPGRDLALREVATQLRQGSAVALSSVLGAGNQRIVDLVVGFFLGPVLLGYLRIAWRMLDLLFEIVVRPISNVSLTSLPRARHAGRSLEGEYLALVRYAAVAIVPMFLGFSAVAPDLIPLIFGARWQTSAELLAILCFIGLFVPFTYFRSSALIAQGAYRHVFLVNLGEFVLSLLCALAFTPFGVTSAAWGYLARAALAAPLTMLYLEKVAGISALRALRAGIPAAFSACCMLAATHAVRLALPAEITPAWRIATLICAGALAYVATILLTDRQLATDAARLRARA
jgi:O-antigen/teichoic acid export membrane protein